MKVIYVASQYTVGVAEENVQAQIEAGHKIMDLGHCAILPLLTHYMNAWRNRPWLEWMTCDYELIHRSDALIRLPGPSKGADLEVELAQKLGKPVFFFWDELEDWLEQFNTHTESEYK